MEGFLGLPGNVWYGIAATIILGVFYLFAALTRETTEVSGWRFSPIVITAGVFGRASIANLQIFFFSLIVFWALFYTVLKDGSLAELSSDVLLLLGVGAAGTAGAKITAIQKGRLSYLNWAWLKRKKWIRQDIGRMRRPPKWSDLVTSDDTFDVFKFQNVVVTLIVGIALLYAGLTGSGAETQGANGGATGLADFEIGDSLLGLLGLSQVAYVGGKAVSSTSPVQELDKALKELRKLEDTFTHSVAQSWAAAPPARDMGEAKMAAPAEYAAYMTAANVAAQMLEDQIGGRHPDMEIEPALP